jgi:putative spermidine/putrescine transport system substrate-binding protein
MTSRHNLLISLMAGAAASASLPAMGSAQEFPTPKQPLVISVIDVAGDLQLSQPVFENFRQSHPDLVSKFVFTQATAPELAGKLKAQQGAGRVDIDFVLTGNDALAAGMEMGLWTEILPKYNAMFPDLAKLYIPGAYAM